MNEDAQPWMTAEWACLSGTVVILAGVMSISLVLFLRSAYFGRRSNQIPKIFVLVGMPIL